nr:Os01g0890250 [Ipomoea batatas]
MLSPSPENNKNHADNNKNTGDSPRNGADHSSFITLPTREFRGSKSYVNCSSAPIILGKLHQILNLSVPNQALITIISIGAARTIPQTKRFAVRGAPHVHRLGMLRYCFSTGSSSRENKPGAGSSEFFQEVKSCFCFVTLLYESLPPGSHVCAGLSTLCQRGDFELDPSLKIKFPLCRGFIRDWGFSVCYPNDSLGAYFLVPDTDIVSGSLTRLEEAELEVSPTRRNNGLVPGKRLVCRDGVSAMGEMGSERKG